MRLTVWATLPIMKSMGQFNININQTGKVAVITTEGYLDDAGGKIFHEKCTEIIDSGAVFLVFNLEKTPVINSTGLSTMLDIMVQVIDYNEGEVAICGLSQLTKTALQMTGVLTLAEAYSTEAEAISAMTEAAGDA